MTKTVKLIKLYQKVNNEKINRIQAKIDVLKIKKIGFEKQLAEKEKQTDDVAHVTKFTARQYQFIMAIVSGLNGTQAALKAGIKLTNARQQAHKWLTNIDIQNEIKKLTLEIRLASGIELSDCMNDFQKIKDIAMTPQPVKKLDLKTKKMVDTGETKIELSAALKATENLTRIIGGFEKDKQKIDVDHTGQIINVVINSKDIKKHLPKMLKYDDV